MKSRVIISLAVILTVFLLNGCASHQIANPNLVERNEKDVRQSPSNRAVVALDNPHPGQGTPNP